MRIEPDIRQECAGYDQEKIESGVKQLLKAYPHNRLVNHLVNNCALTYHCPAARNFSWAMGMSGPVSPACNANCVGCISLQPDEETIVSTQDRLTLNLRRKKSWNSLFRIWKQLPILLLVLDRVVKVNHC